MQIGAGSGFAWMVTGGGDDSMSRGGTPHWLQPCTWLRSRLRCSALERPAFERMASASARSKKSNCCRSPPVIGSVRAQCCSCSALFSSMLPSRLATSSDVRPRPLPAASPSGRSSGSSCAPLKQDTESHGLTSGNWVALVELSVLARWPRRPCPMLWAAAMFGSEARLDAIVVKLSERGSLGARLISACAPSRPSSCT
eukprot:scaffold46716_cov72-Phaeocystis_antarctica.AAC.5